MQLQKNIKKKKKPSDKITGWRNINLRGCKLRKYAAKLSVK